MTATLTAATALSATDRCDRCGAAAAVRAVLNSGGELLFCGHHAQEYSAKLTELDAQLHDSREN